LVDEGLLAEQMKRTGIVRAFPTRITVSHPTHVPRRARNSSIDLHAEVLKVLPSEERLLTTACREEFLRQLSTYQPRAKRTF
jgi:hypothetical protein